MSQEEQPQSLFELATRVRSFRFAIQGLLTLLRTQPNARIHMCATLIVIVMGIVFDISRIDWLFLCVAIAMVWVAEALNTAIEHLADAVFPEYHPHIEKAKDTAAAAVLIAAAIALLIGLLVFGPYW